MSLAMLFDGRGISVRKNAKAIRQALRWSDRVEISGWPIHIANFSSDARDEVNVYDGRRVHQPEKVFEPAQVDQAIERFLELVREVQEN